MSIRISLDDTDVIALAQEAGVPLDQHARTTSKEPPRRAHPRWLPGLLLALLPLLAAPPVNQHPGHVAISKPGNVAIQQPGDVSPAVAITKPGNVAIQQPGGLPPSIAIQKPGHPPAA